MTFSEDFAKNQGRPIVFGGRTLEPMLRRTVAPETRVRVVWRSAAEVPVQGIRMKLQGGSLILGDTELKDVVLWRDTAPDESVFVCRSKRATELRIWNCWRDERGVTQAWIGNAGMRTTEFAAGIIAVECNSRPEITFRDLVFDLYLEQP